MKNNSDCDLSSEDIYSILLKINNDSADEHKISNEKIIKLTELIDQHKFYKIKDFFDNYEKKFYSTKLFEKSYDSDLLEDYNYKLINILKKIPKDDSINNFVLEKIKYYKELNESFFINNEIFNTTIKYLENPENFYTNDDIIDLFNKDKQKAIIEFNKLNNFKHIIYIYKKIKNINDVNITEILLNKIDNYLYNYENSYIERYMLDCLFLLISKTEDEEIIKKYGIIILKYRDDYELFIKIKPLCNEIELQTILNNIKDNYISSDVFDILYDYKLYDRIYDLISTIMIDTMDMLEYCNLLKEHIPDKICILLQKNIEKILDSKNPKYYIETIDFLKIYQSIVSEPDFITYTNDLIKKHGRKTKFKKLFNKEFE